MSFCPSFTFILPISEYFIRPLVKKKLSANRFTGYTHFLKFLWEDLKSEKIPLSWVGIQYCISLKLDIECKPSSSQHRHFVLSFFNKVCSD